MVAARPVDVVGLEFVVVVVAEDVCLSGLGKTATKLSPSPVLERHSPGV